MAYEAGNPPSVSQGNQELRALTDYLFRELLNISASFQEVSDIQLQVLHKDLDKPRNGMIILVDGSNFNPGSGAGFYGRSAGAWVKLG